MTIVPARWRSVFVKTYVYDDSRVIDERVDVWRGPWPEVEAVVKRGTAYVSLNYAGERWCSILTTSDDGWTCLGEEASRRVVAGELDPAEAYFSTTFTFPRGVSERTDPQSRTLVMTNVDKIARWRAGDVPSLLWKRILFPGIPTRRL